MSLFLTYVASACLAVLFASALVCVYRIAIGPGLADRAVALDVLTLVFIGIICLLCMLWSSTLYFDAVWIVTLIGFLGTVAVARYMIHGQIF